QASDFTSGLHLYTFRLCFIGNSWIKGLLEISISPDPSGYPIRRRKAAIFLLGGPRKRGDVLTYADQITPRRYTDNSIGARGISFEIPVFQVQGLKWKILRASRLHRDQFHNLAFDWIFNRIDDPSGNNAP